MTETRTFRRREWALTLNEDGTRDVSPRDTAAMLADLNETEREALTDWLIVRVLDSIQPVQRGVATAPVSRWIRRFIDFDNPDTFNLPLWREHFDDVFRQGTASEQGRAT